MTRLTSTLNLPHLNKATIGFTQMFDQMERQFANSPNGNGYPPYNIEGTMPEADEKATYLHKGISSRKFNREFTLADHVEVKHASLELGMLYIDLVREVPESLKPKKIVINGSKVLNHKK